MERPLEDPHGAIPRRASLPRVGFLTSTGSGEAPSAGQGESWPRVLGARMLLSFERPTGRIPAGRLLGGPWKLHSHPTNGYHRSSDAVARNFPWRAGVVGLSDTSGGAFLGPPRLRIFGRLLAVASVARRFGGVHMESKDHRQDVKGTRWMPWHQESMKGVNGCDKPR